MIDNVDTPIDNVDTWIADVEAAIANVEAAIVNVEAAASTFKDPIKLFRGLAESRGPRPNQSLMG